MRPPALPPLGLPVEEVLPALDRALAGSGVVVLRAPPGAGKTTVVPLHLLGAPWLADHHRVVVLQPRRLAARAVATRMASLLGEAVGATVGYRTRDERRVGPGTRVEVVTEGILTRRLQQDPTLPGTGVVVFDEVHLRHLVTDLALALTVEARGALRPDLRLVAMSATVDAGPVADLLGGAGPPAPTVSSDGRQYPVDIRWVGSPATGSPATGSARRVGAQAAATVARALRETTGDVLVFLPGAAEIRQAAEVLGADGLLGTDGATGVDVRPLYGALAANDQDAALRPSTDGRRRVVLATDIAETSLTVPGVDVVVDAGLARAPRTDPRSGLTRLHTGPASRSSSEQRAGRAGRIRPGVAYRMWDRSSDAARPARPVPEILTADLSSLVLELAVWGADAEELRWMDAPPARALAEGRALLGLLGALGPDGRLTPTGRAMAELPVHPRLAAMLVARPGRRTAAIAAVLEEGDVLSGRPEALPVDLDTRIDMVLERGARHPALDRRALTAARRQADRLDRSAPGRGAGAPVASRDAGGQVADRGTAETGLLVARAYPDRVAQGTGGGRFRLRTGTAAFVPVADPLAGEDWLVVAAADIGPGRDGRPGDGRVRMAAAIDEADVEAATGAVPVVEVTVAWDARRDDLRARTTRRIDALVLATSEGPAPPGPATVAALVDRVTESGLDALSWSPAARSLQGRAAFAHRFLGGDWPDVSDPTLVADAGAWLAPLLTRATGRAQLDAVSMTSVLRDRIGRHRLARLDALVPETLALGRRRAVPVDYRDGRPVAAVRVQDLFGVTVHPTVAGGRVPVVLELLSPAGRPVQTTADLPGFWAGSWSMVRSEMAGRYPRHSWPVDPSIAQPPPSRRR